MLIKEFRVVLPMSVEEYQVAQLYSVAEASKNETGGGDGIEVLKNEKFTASVGVQPKEPLLGGEYNEGQYTEKIYHLSRKVPNWVRKIAPKGSLTMQETAWNAYPYCRTVITNDDYMKGNFFIMIESLHLPDRGDTENAHGLSGEALAKRTVMKIDIANDPIRSKDYKAEEDPTKYKSVKTDRGPLGQDWIDSVDPVMCCYKLVTVKFKWWGLQSRIESFIQKTEQRLFTNFHRQLFCWTDRWHGLTLQDIRAIEDRTKDELDKQILTSEIRGTRGGEDD